MSHRNEPARDRHRQQTKLGSSLRSLPLDNKGRNLTLDNHFGWTTLQKCQVGDGGIPSYPQVVHIYEKPDRKGPGFGKVTNIMYLKGKDDTNTLGKVEKEIQTSSKMVTISKPVQVSDHPRGVIIEEPEHKEHVTIEHVDKKHKKKDKKEHKKEPKLIESFYAGSGEKIFKQIDEDTHKQLEANPVVVENYTTDYVPPKKKKPKKGSGRSKPKSWQLRSAAGAQTGSDVMAYVKEYGYPEEESDEDEDEEEEEETKENYLVRSDTRRYYDRVMEDRRTEQLVEARKKNEYLYMPRNQLRTLRDRS